MAENLSTGFSREPLRPLIEAALAEDVGQGDVTSALLIPEKEQGTGIFRSRQRMVMAAGILVPMVYEALGADVACEVQVEDRMEVAPSTALAKVRGNARAIFAGERVALNLLQRACGVATCTHAFVEAVQGTRVQILDTRKTMPGMRILDKYAVTCGGGFNHRMRLDDRILIKDNHIAVCGGIKPAIAAAKAGNAGKLLIEAECDRLEQVAEAAEAGVDWILLDNMPLDMLQQAVTLNAGRAKLEASGGVTLATVRAIAETGVNAISVGAITHSAPAADIGLDIEIET